MSMISWPSAIVGAFLDGPAGEHALLHGEAPFRHGDRLDCGHRFPVPSRRSWRRRPPLPTSCGTRTTRFVAVTRRRPSAVIERRADGRLDLGDARDVEVLERRREGHRRVRRGDLLDRRLQRTEGLLGDEPGDVGGHAAARMRLVDDDQPAGLLDRLEDGLGVERRGGARVDHRAADPLLGEIVGRLLGEVHHAAEGDDGHVIALARRHWPRRRGWRRARPAPRPPCRTWPCARRR